LEAAIKDRLAAEVELVAGTGGVFAVFREGELIFSKNREKRFPETAEIIDRLSQTPSPSSKSEPE
jgi:selT/selW/selH-like putative selenoprotein